MTKEKLEQGILLQSQIADKKAQLNKLNVVLDKDAPDQVPVKVYGTQIEMPKAGFLQKLNARKVELTQEIADLQAQFDAL